MEEKLREEPKKKKNGGPGVVQATSMSIRQEGFMALNSVDHVGNLSKYVNLSQN